jgi:hypothetical protein
MFAIEQVEDEAKHAAQSTDNHMRRYTDERS